MEFEPHPGAPLTVERVLEYHAAGGEMNARDEYGYTLLLRAIEQQDYDLVALLLALDADPDVGFRTNDTGRPLIYAVLLGQLNIIQILFRANADVSHIERNPRVVHRLFQREAFDVIRACIDAGLNVNMLIALEFGAFETLLGAAVRSNNLDLIIQLLEQNVDVNIQDSRRRTPLFYAIEEERVEVVEALLELGANPNICDLYGSYPLLLALRKQHPQIIEALVTAGANLERIEKIEIFGSALQMAIMTGQSDTFDFLLANGADVKYVNSQNENILDSLLYAHGLGYYDDAETIITFRRLVTQGATIQQMKNREYIPWTFYARGTWLVTWELLRQGLKIKNFFDIRDPFPPLHEALRNSDFEYLKYLVQDCQVNIESRDRDGNTVLMHAAKDLQPLRIEQILELGGNVRARNTSGECALQLTMLGSMVVTNCFKLLLRWSHLQEILTVLHHAIAEDKTCYEKCIIRYLAIITERHGLPVLQTILRNIPYESIQYFTACTQELTESWSQRVGRVDLGLIITATTNWIAARDTSLLSSMRNADLAENFPIYWDESLGYLEVITERQKLVKEVIPVLSKIVSLPYPGQSLIIDKIASYLNQEDLGVLALCVEEED